LREPIVIGRNVVLYGEVDVGAGSVIEDNVVLGHPSPTDLQRLELLQSGAGVIELDAKYDAAASAPTVIGAGARIRSNSVVYAGTTIGERLDCAHNVVIREGCVLDADVYLFAGAVVKPGVTIGRGARVSNTVGNRTRIGHAASMLGYTVHAYTIGVGGVDEPAPSITTGATVSRGAVIVGDVTVGAYALVGANAVVREDVEPKSVVGGIPARPIKQRSDEDLAAIYRRLRELGLEHEIA
jgi:acetyltransferase-like isoleucine patch superfamily enzyme